MSHVTVVLKHIAIYIFFRFQSDFVNVVKMFNLTWCLRKLRHNVGTPYNYNDSDNRILLSKKRKNVIKNYIVLH